MTCSKSQEVCKWPWKFYCLCLKQYKTLKEANACPCWEISEQIARKRKKRVHKRHRYDRCKYDVRFSTKAKWHEGCEPLICRCGKRKP